MPFTGKFDPRLFDPRLFDVGSGDGEVEYTDIDIQNKSYFLETDAIIKPIEISVAPHMSYDVDVHITTIDLTGA